VDAAIAQRFQPYLAPGEALLWTGRPVQGFSFQHGDLLTVPFGAVWLAFTVNWLSAAPASSNMLSFVFLGSILTLMTGYLLLGRYISDLFLRARTYYAVTQRQALILSGWRGTTFTSVDLDRVSETHLIRAGDDRGTIIFGPTNDQPFWQGRSERSASPEFFKVEQAQSVYSLIQKQQRTS